MKGIPLLVLLCVVATGTSNAAEPAKPVPVRAAFAALVTNLQASPADDALRRQLIDAARALKPAPAVPDEVLKREGRAEFYIAGAKGPDDFRNAAREYDAAIVLAPWLARLYYSQGAALEKAGDSTAAIRSYNWYLAADPAAQDADAVKKKIGMLEVAGEQAAVKREQDRRAKEAMDYAMSMLSGSYKEISCSMQGAPMGNGGWHMRGCTHREAGGTNWSSTLSMAGSANEICTFQRRDINDIRIACPSYSWMSDSKRLTYDATLGKVVWQVKDDAGGWKSQWTEIGSGFMQVMSDRSPDSTWDESQSDPAKTYFRTQYVKVY